MQRSSSFTAKKKPGWNLAIFLKGFKILSFGIAFILVLIRTGDCEIFGVVFLASRPLLALSEIGSDVGKYKDGSCKLGSQMEFL